MKYTITPIIVVITVFSVLIFLINDSEPEPILIYESGFTYYDIELVQKTLAEHDIIVSSPTAITDDTISQYCLYFDGDHLRSVSYCTTTAVYDSLGNDLGNLNLGGTLENPILAIVNLEDDLLNSNATRSFTIFEGVIRSLVCDCWEEQSSQEFPTILSWLEAAEKFYIESGQKNIKSKIENLDNTELLLEITSKENSTLRTLVILKIV